MTTKALSRLRSRRPVFGTLQMLPLPNITELALWSGFDFIILDCEHGIVDESAHIASLQVIAPSEAFSVVRVRPGDFRAVGRYLDFGADAILFPDIKNAADAARFVAAATHGPNGTRSSTSGATRAQRYGLLGPGDRGPNLLLAMIEGAEAVANIASIAATPGLDGLIIGPADLAADLRCPDDFSTEAYTKAFLQVEEAARQAGLLLGSREHPGFPVRRLLDCGHCFILCGSDIGALRDGYRSQLGFAQSKQPV